MSNFRNIGILCIILIYCILAESGTVQSAEGDTGALPAFPGAVGYGVHAAGGRGGKVIKVTNLNAKGPGSLFAALAASGPRIVVFDVSGVVQGMDMRMGNGQLTLACQTAPGPGIAFTGHLRFTGAKDIIVRHLRIRFRGPNGKDSVLFTKGDNIMVDHTSVSWGADESLSLPGTKNATVQWTTIEESRLCWEGGDEPHNFGMIISGGPSSLNHILFANHNGRAPAAQYGIVLDYRNSVIYNFGYGSIGIPPGGGNIVSNYIKHGPGALFGSPRIYHPVTTLTTPGIGLGRKGNQKLYVEGNYITHAGGYSEPGAGGRSAPQPKADVPPVTHVAREAYELVCAVGGALPRDEVTARHIYEMRTGTGLWDEQLPRGDWRARMAGGKPKPDSDNDGMPDDWEKAHGLNPDDPADANKTVPAGGSKADRHKGYTYIEYYINDRADILEAEALTGYRLRTSDGEEPPKPEWKDLPKSIDELVADIENQNYARIAKTEELSKKWRQMRNSEGKSEKTKELKREIGRQGGGQTGTGQAWKAIWAFKDAGPAAGPAAEKLAKIMDTNDNRQALFIAWALGMIAPFADETVVVPVLIKGLERTDYVKPVRNSKWNMNPRGFIAWALGRFGPRAKEAVPALAKTMHGKDGWARQPAAWALREIGKDASSAIDALIKALGTRWGGSAYSGGCGYHAAHALARIGEPALSAVITALETVPRKGGSQARRAAAVSLGLMGAKAAKAVPALIKALSADSPLLKAEAALSLSKIDPSAEGVVPALVNAMSDKDYSVRDSVAQAIGNCGPAAKDAIPALVTALADQKKEVQYSAAEALGRIGPAAAPALIKAMSENQDGWLRSKAAQALGRTGAKTAPVVSALTKALDDKSELVRREACWSLALVGHAASSAAQRLQKAVDDDDYMVRVAAAETLKRIR